MDGKDGIGSEALPNKGRGTINSNVFVFAFFLFLSFVFWYLNSLGKDIETEIRYPVTLTSIPLNSIPVNDFPSKIYLTLKGPGYSILQLKISGKTSPLKIDYSKEIFKRVTNKGSFDYYVVTAGLIPSFNAQLKAICKVTLVRPDTLFFSSDKLR